MKKLLFRVCAVSVALFILAGCTNNDDTPHENANGNAYAADENDKQNVTSSEQPMPTIQPHNPNPFPQNPDEVIEWGHSWQRIVFQEGNPEMVINNAVRQVDESGAALVVVNETVLLPLTAAIRASGRGVIWEVDGENIAVARGSASTTAIGYYIDGILHVPLMDIASEINLGSLGWDETSGTLIVTTGGNVRQGLVSHRDSFGMPDAWFGSQESIRLADNYLIFQRNNGGWPRLHSTVTGDMARVLTEADITRLTSPSEKSRIDTYFGNETTIREIRFLIRMYEATGIERFRESFVRGLVAVLNCQYDNGGFPSYLTDRSGYRGTITHNDGGMTYVLILLQEISDGDYFSIDDELVERSRLALERGIQNLIDTQIWSEEKQMYSAWAQHHHPVTLLPAWGRAHEPAAVAAWESLDIVHFLMSVENPSEDVQLAIHRAVAWYEYAVIADWELWQNAATNNNRVAVEVPGARHLWGRYHCTVCFLPTFVRENNLPGRLTVPGNPIAICGIYGGEGNVEMWCGIEYFNVSGHPALRDGYQFIGSWPRNLRGYYTNWLIRNGLPIPVFDIVEIPSQIAANETVMLKPIVLPRNADNQTIIWEIDDAGTTEAIITDNAIIAANTGVITLRALIAGGGMMAQDYVQYFSIEVMGMISVESISGVPATLPIGQFNFHRAAAVPQYAMFTNITWQIINAGTTGAMIDGVTFSSTTAGVATIMATVQNGIAEGEDFTKFFDIIIEPDPAIAATLPANALITNWYVWRYNLNEGMRDFSYETNFAVGDHFFGDRPAATWAVIADFINTGFLQGKDWLRTANDGRQQNNNPTTQMMFTAAQDITVYFAVEHRVDVTRIGWLDDTWEFMGLNVMIGSGDDYNPEPHGLDVFTGFPNIGYSKHYIFKRDFTAGEVVRMGHMNIGTTLLNMFVIIEAK